MLFWCFSLTMDQSPSVWQTSGRTLAAQGTCSDQKRRQRETRLRRIFARQTLDWALLNNIGCPHRIRSNNTQGPRSQLTHLTMKRYYQDQIHQNMSSNLDHCLDRLHRQALEEESNPGPPGEPGSSTPPHTRTSSITCISQYNIS